MSRSLARSSGLAAGSFLMLAAAIVLVRREPSAPPVGVSTREGASVDSDARAAELTALHLTDTRVTGQDLHWLPSMPNLLTLKLNRLAIGDDAVADLGLFPSVQHLEIDGTAITDHGLRTLLAQNSALQRVELRYSAVTPQGLAQLQQAYPNVQLVSAESSGGPVLR
jgi:hypothetical protein